MDKETQERAKKILNDLVGELGEGYSVSDENDLWLNRKGIGTILMISELMSRRGKSPQPTGRLYINVFWGARANLFHERSNGTFRSGLVDFIKARVATVERTWLGID